MQVNWRTIHAARNTYAILQAACEHAGFPLRPVECPLEDITCYSLNSLNASFYHDEIGIRCLPDNRWRPHATACPEDVAEFADYVIVGEGEFTLPRLLADLRNGAKGRYPA